MKKTLLLLFCLTTFWGLFAQKTELFILSVGVKEYKNPSLNLKFADADARDLAAAWQKQTNLYDVRNTKVLLNSQATRENIRNAFKEFKGKITANDLFVFIFSGHGIDESLVPYDFDINDPYATAFGKGDFKTLISDLGCNYLVMLDACHSGSFAKSVYGSKDISPSTFQLSVENASKQLYEALSDADKNSITIASSSSNQLSFECEKCGHGYFAQVILDCFNGVEVTDPSDNTRRYVPNANGDTNGFVSVLELENYVYEAVRIKSAQSGTSQKARIMKATGRDFPLLQTANRRIVPPPPPAVQDRDGDGIIDSTDRCPDDKGISKLKGCPDEDKDGIADLDDNCKSEAGPISNKGCPEIPIIKAGRNINSEFKNQTSNYPTPPPVTILRGQEEVVIIKPGRNTNFTENHDSLGIQMVLVEGGTFLMGSNDGENDEKPIHSVTVSDFYIGKYEVTNLQFCKFLNEKGNQKINGVEWVDLTGSYGFEKCRIYFQNNRFYVQNGYENSPIIYVSWHAATEFCKWLEGKTNKKYRLPTEEEWEYAARGGSKSQGYMYSGSNTISDIVQHEGSYKNISTSKVGSKNANELGIHDMSGNVGEWCEDMYKSYNGGSDVSNHIRVVRGGSWFTIDSFYRVANRDNHPSNNRWFGVGFRLAFSR